MINKKSSTKRLVMSKDLNGANKLFGGTILAWMDEQAYIAVRLLLKSENVVTKYISEVEFLSGAGLGDIVEIETTVTKIGKTSISLSIEVNNKTTEKVMTKVSNITMVNVNSEGKPEVHKLD